MTSSRGVCSVIDARSMLGVLRAIGALVLLSALSTACSQNGSAAGKAPGGPDVPPEGGVSDAVDLGLPEPTDGFQILSRGAEIAPGEEREYCEVGRLPGGADDVYYVSFIELANGSGSHHLGLGVAEVGSPSEAKLIELGEGNRVECPGPRIAFGDRKSVV